MVGGGGGWWQVVATGRRRRRRQVEEVGGRWCPPIRGPALITWSITQVIACALCKILNIYAAGIPDKSVGLSAKVSIAH